MKTALLLVVVVFLSLAGWHISQSDKPSVCRINKYDYIEGPTNESECEAALALRSKREAEEAAKRIERLNQLVYLQKSEARRIGCEPYSLSGATAYYYYGCSKDARLFLWGRNGTWEETPDSKFCAPYSEATMLPVRCAKYFNL